MSDSPNKKTIERCMDGFRKGDHAEVLACLTDDAEWEVPGYFHLKGKEAFVGRPAIEITRMTEENDVVVAEGSVRSAGGFLNAMFCDVFVLRGGKISRLVSYLMELKP